MLLGHASVKNARSRTSSHLGFEGCVADVNALDKRNRTALHSASSCGKLEIARHLLDSGSNVNAETDSGETPLHGVAKVLSEDGVRVARLLITRPALGSSKLHGYFSTMVQK